MSRYGEVLSALTVLMVSIVGLGIWISSDDGDGIEEGKNYRLAATYKVRIEYAPGKTIPGRVFDFADRNLPRTSVAVPVEDARGIALVRQNSNLPKSTVRKSRIRVLKQVVDDVVYPAYEYVLWEYSTAIVEVQNIDPPVIPKH